MPCANHRVEFQAHYAHCRLWIAVWHRLMTGRFTRWHHVEKFLHEIPARDEVWFAPLGEIADHVLKCADEGQYQPRTDRLPFHDTPASLDRPEVG
jgi:hypothetical protein